MGRHADDSSTVTAALGAVARLVAARARPGEVIGVGTGRSADAVTDALAARVSAERLDVSVLVTSFRSAARCGASGLTVLDPVSFPGEADWGYDGADEIDPRLRLIKGKGAALLREKILAARCRRFVVVADRSKLVERLGERTPVPVEIVPDARAVVERGLSGLPVTEVTLRDAAPGAYGPVCTERGNLILDVRFREIDDDLERRLKALVGVVETGLFIGRTTEAVVGDDRGGADVLAARSE